MTTSALFRPCLGVLACLALVGCSGERGESSTGGAPGGDDGDGSADGDGGGDGNGGDGNDGGDDGDGVLYDVGGGPGDDGDGGPPPESTCEAAAEDKSSMGCEFWAVDLPNGWGPSIWNPDNPIPEAMQFAVVVANASYESSASVNVHLDGNVIDSATVSINAIHMFKLPRNDIDPQNTSTDGKAFFVDSDVPIAAYQFQPLDNTVPPYSNDASLLLPVHSFDKDYVAVTSYATSMNVDGPGSNMPSNMGSFISVVATEDNTTVDVFPTDDVAGGQTEDVAIDRGQVFTVIGDGHTEGGKGNLSGSRVSSDKPVATFSGNVAAQEPLGVSGCCLDHIEHQLLPMSAWSNQYVAAPPPRYDGKIDESSVYRIVGAFDDTQLSYDPARPSDAPETISAAEMVEFTTKEAFTITGTDPFSVTQFLQSNGTLGYGGPRPGDPAMWVVPPVAQHQAKYVFLSPKGYEKNFVTIITEAGTEVALDGETVAGQFYMNGSIEGRDYLHIHMPVEPGSHLIEAEEPVGLSVFGYDNDVSYAYPGGSGIKYIYDPPPPPEG